MAKERKQKSISKKNDSASMNPYRHIVQSFQFNVKPEPPKTKAVLLRLKPYLYESLRACAEVSDEIPSRLAMVLLEQALTEYAAALVAEYPGLATGPNFRLLSPSEIASFFDQNPDEEPEGDD